jgi:membrane protein DedA with SNARE-associated domain
MFETWGIAFVIVAGFTPIPFKIITIAGGALLMPLPAFVLGSVIGRGARFFLVGGLIRTGGERMAEHLREYVDLLGWLVIALGVIVAVVLGLRG